MDTLQSLKHLRRAALYRHLLLGGSVLLFSLSTDAKAATVTVEVRNYRFEPSEVTIAPGDTVRWIWRAGAHTATSGTACVANRAWDIPFTPDAPDAQFKFEVPGEYPYFCRPHCTLGMTGKVVVAGATEPPQIVNDPIPEAIRPAKLPMRLRADVGGLIDPVSAIAVPGKPRRLLVGERDGRIWSLNARSGVKFSLADLRPWLSQRSDSGTLQGIAVHPEFSSNGRLYTLTREAVNGAADFTTVPTGLAADAQTVLREWIVTQPQSARAAVNSSSVRVVLRVDTWSAHRNEGHLAATPDGLLWFSVGGGALQRPAVGNDPGERQGLDTVLGKVLRIDPSYRPAMQRGYSVPADNPFAQNLRLGENSCDDGVCDEIFAYGFRHPGLVTPDGSHNLIYVVDSGDSQLQEINRVTKGGNYGWPVHEGHFCRAVLPDGIAGLHLRCPPGGQIPPLAQYDIDEGTGIVAGLVYRGRLLPALRGHYVFADAGAKGLRNARLFYLTRKNLTAADRGEAVTIRELRPRNWPKTGFSVTGLVADGAGELYAFGQRDESSVNGKTGFLQQIVP